MDRVTRRRLEVEEERLRGLEAMAATVCFHLRPSRRPAVLAEEMPPRRLWGREVGRLERWLDAGRQESLTEYATRWGIED